MLRRAEVQNRIGLARSTIYQRVAEGTLPAPVRLGGARAVAWVEDEINTWIEQQIALSRASNSGKGVAND
jgi:prophage regulatory protein